MNQSIPTYNLYGERTGEKPEFWVHAESISSRSRVHNWQIKPHRHESLFQILYIRAGSGSAQLGPQTQALSAPCVVVMPEHHEHGYQFSRDIDGAVITLVSRHFAPCRPTQPGISDWLSAPRYLHIDKEHPDAAYLVDTLDRIEREIMLGTPGAVTLIESLLASALLLMPRISGMSADTDGNRDRARFAELSELIKDGFRSHLPVEFYARRLGISVTHLNRITRSIAGKPLSRLIADRIITEAKRDLVFTSISIQQIADSLGFEDQAYFSRFFSRHAGLSPRNYRDREQSR